MIFRINVHVISDWNIHSNLLLERDVAETVGSDDRVDEYLYIKA